MGTASNGPRRAAACWFAMAALLVSQGPATAAGKVCPPLPYALEDALRVARSFGVVRVGSTCNGRHVRNSFHYRGRAVDFRVMGNVAAAVVRFFRSWPGGFAHYGGGLIHLDTGPFRRWR